MKEATARGGSASATPHPSAFGRHLLPQGEKENSVQITASKAAQFGTCASIPALRPRLAIRV